MRIIPIPTPDISENRFHFVNCPKKTQKISKPNKTKPIDLHMSGGAFKAYKKIIVINKRTAAPLRLIEAA